MCKKILLFCTAVLFVTGVIIGCSKLFGSDDSSGRKVSISGNLARGTAKASAITDVDSVFAVPCVNGDFTSYFHSTNVKHAFINTSGTFSIELDAGWTDKVGGDLDVEWVLLLMNSKAANNFDKVEGFVSLKQGDRSMVQIPVGKAKTDDIQLGTMRQKGNEAVGDTAKDTATFNLTLEQLKQMAQTGKALKMIKNIYGNYDFANDYMFSIRPMYGFNENLSYDDIKNKELLPSTYLDTSKITYQLIFFSTNVTLFNYSQMVSRAVSFDLYPPKAIWMKGSSSTNIAITPTIPVSTDTTKNPSVTGTNNGQTVVIKPDVYLPALDGIHQSFGFLTFMGVIPNGIWLLKKNTGETVARFDLGLGNPFDSTTGRILVPVPSLQVSVNASNVVQSVTVKWYQMDQTTGAYSVLSDPEVVKRAISLVEVRIQTSNDNPEMAKAGRYPGGLFCDQKEVPTSITLTPTRQFTLASPTYVGVSYYTGGQQYCLAVAQMQ